MVMAIAALGFTAPAFADTQKSFSEQMQAQKTQLRPHVFNFFSDRYQQIEAQNAIKPVNLSFKEQLDSQKGQLRTQEFNPISDAYLQTTSRHS